MELTKRRIDAVRMISEITIEMSSSARAASYVVLSKWAVTLHSCLKAEENDMPPRAALVRSVLEQQRRLAAAWGAGQEDKFVARRGRRSGVRQEQRRPAHLVSLATREEKFCIFEA